MSTHISGIYLLLEGTIAELHTANQRAREIAWDTDKKALRYLKDDYLVNPSGEYYIYEKPSIFTHISGVDTTGITTNQILQYNGTEFVPVDMVAGSTDHNTLTNRDMANQHPITAISGLQSALDGKLSTVTTDATLTGNGTSTNPLSVVGGGGGSSLWDQTNNILTPITDPERVDIGDVSTMIQDGKLMVTGIFPDPAPHISTDVWISGCDIADINGKYTSIGTKHWKHESHNYWIAVGDTPNEEIYVLSNSSAVHVEYYDIAAIFYRHYEPYGSWGCVSVPAEQTNCPVDMVSAEDSQGSISIKYSIKADGVIKSNSFVYGKYFVAKDEMFIGFDDTRNSSEINIFNNYNTNPFVIIHQGVDYLQMNTNGAWSAPQCENTDIDAVPSGYALITKNYADAHYLGGGGSQTLSGVLTQGNDGGAKQIKNILDPTVATDAATMSYVDTQISGIPSGVIPNLQTVTDKGALTSNHITVGDPVLEYSNLTKDGLNIYSNQHVSVYKHDLAVIGDQAGGSPFIKIIPSGIIGRDYNKPLTDVDYVQKKYVDTAISGIVIPSGSYTLQDITDNGPYTNDTFGFVDNTTKVIFGRSGADVPTIELVDATNTGSLALVSGVIKLSGNDVEVATQSNPLKGNAYHTPTDDKDYTQKKYVDSLGIPTFDLTTGNTTLPINQLYKDALDAYGEGTLVKWITPFGEGIGSITLGGVEIVLSGINPSTSKLDTTFINLVYDSTDLPAEMVNTFTFQSKSLQSDGSVLVDSTFTPTASGHIVNKAYVDNEISNIVFPSGTNLSGVLIQGNDGGAQQIKNISYPTDVNDAATMSYVDTQISGIAIPSGNLLHANLTDISTNGHPASVITYSNTTSGLTATSTQAAIDEIDGLVDSNTTNISNLSGVYEPIIAPKNTAFNKNFGTANTDVARGDHTHSINELSDVDTNTTSPVTGEVLVWDGTNWVPGVNGGIPLAGPTANRPASPAVPTEYFDTDLGYPIWWNGTNWVNGSGAIV